MDQNRSAVPSDKANGVNDQFWDSVAQLFAHRKLIVGVTGVAAVASVIVSLLLPVWFTASSRLILPEAPSNSLAAVLGGAELSATAKSLLGGSSGDYSRYLTILTSRTVMVRAIETFDLVSVFELEDADVPLERALEEFSTRVSFAIDSDYEFMTISVTDHDRQRAADIANFLVAELNRMNSQLSSQTAANFREYVESRLDGALGERDSLFAQIRVFQETYGVYDLDVQSQVFFQQVGELRSMQLQAEIQYEALLDRLGRENSQVMAAESMVKASRQKYLAALAGAEAILPVSRDTMPAMIREYSGLELQRVIVTTVIESLAPVVEQARFDELRQAEAVQVVDVATPPAFKSKPKRAFFCIAVTLSAFLLSIFFVLTSGWLATARQEVSRRLHDVRGAS